MSEPPHTPNLSRYVGLIVILAGLIGGVVVGLYVEPRWELQYAGLDVEQDAGGLFYIERGERQAVEEVLEKTVVPTIPPGEVGGAIVVDSAGEYFRVNATKHFGIWSLLPAAVAIGLCLIIREPIVSLLVGIVSGGLMLGLYDLTEKVFMPALASDGAAGVLLLYAMLGGLLGIWSRSGAAAAFADWATRHIVRGPRTAKLVVWGLGLVFFQGGTISTILVGTSVKPIADKERISHEELSYIVDSTASPIAILLAFNAWPAYIQALIFVPGVAALATESDRLAFFFRSLPLSFYAIFAVMGTFLLALDKAPFLGRQMRDAIVRARTTGGLDRPGAEPLAAVELQGSDVPSHYRPSMWAFVIPLVALLGIAVGTFLVTGSPQIRWAFGVAVLIAVAMTMGRGLTLPQLMDGVGTGLKGIVIAGAILLLAITLGTITQQTGGGAYLVSSLGDSVPYWLLPVALMGIAMAIAFATGSSWGTYAVAFPLAMPLAWSVANGQGLERPMLFLSVCFAAVLNGSVWGDQCSPISDTTIFSSMTCGADLMDHVKTQLWPATIAAVLAMVGWEIVVLGFC